MVTGPPGQLASIANLVQQLDRPVTDITEVRAFRLLNADPTELADVATFAPFAEWQIQPVLDIAEAVQIATEAIKFRDSIG